MAQHSYKWFVACTIPVLFSLLAGCADEYSKDVKFRVRTDPILKKPPEDETYTIDQPGRLPLLSVKQITKPNNPYYPIRDKVQFLDTTTNFATR